MSAARTDAAAPEWRGRLVAFIGVMVAVSVPFLFAGKVPLGVALGLAFLTVLVAVRPGDTVATLTRATRGALGLAFGAVLATWLISALGSRELFWSLAIWARTAVFVAAAALFAARLAERPAALDLARRTFVAAALAAVLVGVISRYLWPELLGFFRTRPIGNSYDVLMALRGYASVVACLAPALLAAAWGLGPRWRAAALAYLPLAAALIHGSVSKAGWLGLGAAALAVAVSWLLLRVARPWRLAFIAALVAAVVAGAAWLITQLPPIPYACENLALPRGLIDPHRQVIWSFAIDKALTAPWFGHGLDVGGSLPGARVLIPCVHQEYMPSHPHNWMVELFAETGLLGLTAVLAALVMLARGALLGAERGRAASWGLIGLAGAFWGSGLVNFSLWSAWWEWTFLAPAALLFAASGYQPPSDRNPFQPSPGRNNMSA